MRSISQSCSSMTKVIRAHVGDAWILGYSRAHARASILDLKSKSRCHANGRARGRKVTKFSSRKNRGTKFSSRKNRVTEFCAGHVVAGWLGQASRQQTRERVVLDTLFLFFLWSLCFQSAASSCRACSARCVRVLLRALGLPDLLFLGLRRHRPHLEVARAPGVLLAPGVLVEQVAGRARHYQFS